MQLYQQDNILKIDLIIHLLNQPLLNQPQNLGCSSKPLKLRKYIVEYHQKKVYQAFVNP